MVNSRSKYLTCHFCLFPGYATWTTEEYVFQCRLLALTLNHSFLLFSSKAGQYVQKYDCWLPIFGKVYISFSFHQIVGYVTNYTKWQPRPFHTFSSASRLYVVQALVEEKISISFGGKYTRQKNYMFCLWVSISFKYRWYLFQPTGTTYQGPANGIIF